MARSDLKSKSEYQHQKELREARKGGKRRQKEPRHVELSLADMEPRPLRLVLVDRSPDNLQEAYIRLKDQLVVQYFKKYKFHEPRQLAVMRGEVLFPDLPFVLHRQFLSQLGAGGRGWKQGALSTNSEGGPGAED